jgi:hypothetical protein
MGGFLSVMKDAFPPKPTFKVDDIPDLKGKVVIVTGGNTGEYQSSNTIVSRNINTPRAI